MSEEIVNKCAVLRGEGKFREAMDLIDSNIDAIDADLKVVVLLQAFYAAKESGDKSLAKKYASMIAEKDQEIPSIQDYLV